MPLTLKEDMTTICDRYQINESDLMRRAIVEFVTNLNQNPNQTSRHMFLWGHTRTSLGYDIDKDLSVTMLRGLLCGGRKGSEEHAGVFCGVGLSLRGNGSGSPTPHFLYPFRIFSATLPVWETWPPPSALFFSKKDLEICQSGEKTGVLTEGLVGDAGTFVDLKTIDTKLGLPKGTSFECGGYADYFAFEED